MSGAENDWTFARLTKLSNNGESVLVHHNLFIDSVEDGLEYLSEYCQRCVVVVRHDYVK